MRLSILLVTAFLVAFVWAAPASAASACSVGGVATFAAGDVGANCPGGANGASEANALSVTTNGAGQIVFTDAKNPVTDADGPAGCSASGNTATCPGGAGFSFDLGAGDDTGTVGPVDSRGLMSFGGT